MVSSLPDPARLVLGTGAASYQVEGAVDEDGRGPSIWDTFAARPGAVRDGTDGSDACDSYHRIPEDLALIEGLGLDYYRFSVAWPRVVPTGEGRVEPRGLDYYERFVDGLLGIGVRPAVTLFHWDLPQPLEDAGGWLSRRTPELFADYVEVVRQRLGDRVALWGTLNEPWCAAYLGYAAGVHAPGRREGGAAHRAAHHLLLGHGLAAERLRAGGDQPVGIALNLAPIWPERPEAAGLAEQIDALRNRVWLGPLLDGAYDDGVLAVAPELADPALVHPGDLELIAGSLDWLGINYYTPVRPDVAVPGRPPHPEGGAYPGVEPFDLVVREPRTDIGWEVEPRGLAELLVDVHARSGLPLLVTENGAACADLPAPDGGEIDDQDRIDYLRGHLGAVHRARSAGADVRGYLVWTLLDNFEWAEGYTKTFGLVHLDRATQVRTPKASYRWLATYAAGQRDDPTG